MENASGGLAGASDGQDEGVSERPPPEMPGLFGAPAAVVAASPGTPPAASSILSGITRDTAITLAKKEGIEIVEQALPRELLYAADEIFLTGTAAEITPVRSVDKLVIGNGERPVTKRIQDMFFGLFSGETEDEWGWLDPVE